MVTIFGYGEDALTFWFLKNQLNEILRRFNDITSPSDCLVFYRPSFGRSGGKKSAEFGEFDAIFASKKNVYLIESKWDNHRLTNQAEFRLRPEQIERHEVFRWYLGNWNKKYLSNWKAFTKEQETSFLLSKKMAPTDSLLSKNLEHIISRLQKHCPNCLNENNIKNVLLFFHSSKSKAPIRNAQSFKIIPIEYDCSSNYITLS